MGQTVSCIAEFAGKRSKGAALLETDQLLFKGTFRVAIPLKEVRSAKANSGDLTLRFDGRSITLKLGPFADKWASKILHPKGLFEKLGIKDGSRVTLLGVRDESLEERLTASQAHVSLRPEAGADIIMFLVNTREELAKLPSLAGLIKKDGAIWIVYPKGKQVIRELDVIAAARQARLVDVKVVSFSESHTGLKLVIPKNRR